MKHLDQAHINFEIKHCRCCALRISLNELCISRKCRIANALSHGTGFIPEETWRGQLTLVSWPRKVMQCAR